MPYFKTQITLDKNRRFCYYLIQLKERKGGEKMADVTFTKKGFGWLIIIAFAVIVGIGAITYKIGHFDGEVEGRQQGRREAKGILRTPEAGRVYEGTVVGKDTSSYYYEFPSNLIAGEKYLYEGNEKGFALIQMH